ncbi:hypothetical protein [Burkholderia ubonensis]|uniref:hypothetical protein n=1 Tax=Burkholderia ubonensis TaxID=101571 RepID=UPI000A41D9C7|nr:hypothetical protein [Burkholderia ubonensis]
MHPYKKPRHTSSARSVRRVTERQHKRLLAKSGKTVEQAAADVSRLHAEAHALMWYACECGHRERIWNSRDGITPFVIPCPSCGSATLYHVAFDRDVATPDHRPHDGQRVFVDMTREQAEGIAERFLAQLDITRDHPRFASTVDNLLSQTTGGSPLVAVAGDVAIFRSRGVAA